MSSGIDLSHRLALRLHALHAADRAWIMSRLGEEARTRLEPMLEELNHLGFRIDQQMLDAIENHAHIPERPIAEDSFQQNIDLLNQAPPEWIIRQLKGEPPAILACLARIHPWTWLDAVRESCAIDPNPVRRDEPLVGPTARVRQALLAELARRFREAPPSFDNAAYLTPPGNENKKGKVISELWKCLPWKR